MILDAAEFFVTVSQIFPEVLATECNSEEERV